MKAFVSYSQKNESLPELSGLLQDLDRLGIGVWVDKKLAGGTIWWNEILDQIRAHGPGKVEVRAFVMR